MTPGQDGPGGGDPEQGRLTRPGRAPVVAALLVGATLTVFGAAQPWAVAGLPSGAGGRDTVLTLTGDTLARPVPALALVVGAAALALTIAGRRGRAVLLAGTALTGTALAGLCGWVIAAPATAVRPILAEHVGLTASSVPVASIEVDLTAWPWVCAGTALLVLITTGAGWWARSGWDATSRFEGGSGPRPTTAGAATDPAGTWDALSEGEDPTADRP